MYIKYNAKKKPQKCITYVSTEWIYLYLQEKTNTNVQIASLLINSWPSILLSLFSRWHKATNRSLLYYYFQVYNNTDTSSSLVQGRDIDIFTSLTYNLGSSIVPGNYLCCKENKYKLLEERKYVFLLFII